MSPENERAAEQTEQKETLDGNGGFCLYIVRHGQPTEYAEPGAPLTELGREQARNFAVSLAPELLSVSHRTNFRILCGGARRQIETAEIIERVLQKLIQLAGRPIPSLVVQKKSSYQFLNPRGLRQLFAKGVSKEDAYRRWIEATDEELGFYGAETPKRISSDIMWLVKAISGHGRQSEMIHVWVTSETIHGAILKDLLSENRQIPQIGFCEALKINLGPNDENALFTFREEMFMRPLNHWS